MLNAQLAAAPLAGVFMMLAVLVPAMPMPVGEPTWLAWREPVPLPGEIDAWDYFVILNEKRQLFINSESLSVAELEPNLRKKFRTRALRIAYVVVSPQLTFGDAADLVSRVRGADLQVALVTEESFPTREEPILRVPLRLLRSF